MGCCENKGRRNRQCQRISTIKKTTEPLLGFTGKKCHRDLQRLTGEFPCLVPARRTLGSQIGRNRKRGLRKYGGRHVTRRICDVRLLSELMSAISKSSGSDLVFLVDFRRHQATTPAIARPCPATRRPMHFFLSALMKSY